MALNLNIPIKDKNPFLYIIKTLDFLTPYSKVTPREQEVLAELYLYNYEMRDIPQKQRSLLLFDADTKNRVSDNLDINVDNYYNIAKNLKKKGFILDSELNPKYLIEDPSGINIKFI